MAGLNDIGCVHKVFGDAPPHDEARLVIVYKKRDERLQTGGQHFGDDFGGGVFKRNRPEVTCSRGDFFLWKENDVGFIKLIKVGNTGVKV